MNHINSSYLYPATLSENTRIEFLYDKDDIAYGRLSAVGKCYPNPFVKGVTIPFTLEEENSRIQLKVYDIMGKVVKTIVRDYVSAGFQTLAWDGRSDQGAVVESGTYCYQLRGDKGVLSSPRIIVKR